MQYITAHFWEKGNTRENNQDSLSLQSVQTDRGSLLLAVVCDGIGGLKEGETASGYAVEQLTDWLYRVGIGKLRMAGLKRLRRGIFRELHAVHVALSRYSQKQGMELGTTLTMVLLLGNEYILFHLGDSRAYLCGKKWKLLTSDDVTSDGALSKCLGSPAWYRPICRHGHLHSRQGILLCTDGFCRKFAPETGLAQLGMVQRDEEELKHMLERMGKVLMDKGERDNMSAICVFCSKRGRWTKW